MKVFFYADLNTKVCVTMAVLPASYLGNLGGCFWPSIAMEIICDRGRRGLAMVLQTFDFPPYKGYVDAHALWHATTIPLAFLWWSFIMDDAEFRTSYHLKKVK
ncbi:hypothetical protein Lalb_Chr01g0009021 [Lupinus albus]|uniref:Post-GPI attachment to proteins factor 3 n=1 Tax=Lupinus albus TaxID=3870 RepID=A0A6A4R2G3_LUPAL|nr:hypothetical protein Lalb_Chr01g0009021 [Lupinus albus]